MKVWRVGVGILLIVETLSVFQANGQSVLEAVDQAPGLAKSGPQIYDATAGIGYSSLTAAPTVGKDLAGVGGEGYAMASMSMGYSHYSARTAFALIYSPSYVRNFGFAALTSFNQALSLSLRRQLNTRWTLLLSGAAHDSTIDQLLFEAAAPSTSSLSGTGGGLSSGALVPAASASPQILLYGTRVLTTSGVTGLTYRPSTRLRLYLGASVLLGKGLDSGKNAPVGSVLPSTTAEQGTGTISYSLSPLSEVAADVTFVNAHSFLADYQTSTVLGAYSRKLNPSWSVSVGGGISEFIFRGQFVGSASRTHALRLATDDGIRYDRQTQHVVFSYSRTTGDSYGLASSAIDSWSASWIWSAPGHSWRVRANGGLQRFSGGPLGAVNFWQAGSGISRALSHHEIMELSYAYMKEVLGPGFAIPDQSIHSVRLTVSWVPLSREAQVFAGSTGRGTGE